MISQDFVLVSREKKIIDGSSIKPSDIVIGLESSGLHSNGYTLINDMLWRHKIFYKKIQNFLLLLQSTIL